jgi:TolB-like protein/DNA-binding winged helix-turn-helix (wHTH) protein/Tfp pilus assembly protein PilF
MATSPQKSRIYQFGHFRVDAGEGLLWRDGEVVQLTPKAFEMLVILVENNGHVVRKEDLMERVWPDTFVEEANLTNNISLLRKVLHGESDEEHYIKTIPRRGYRFVADVRAPLDAIGQQTSDNIHRVQKVEEGIAQDQWPVPTRYSLFGRFDWRIVVLAAGFVAVVTLSIAVWRGRRTSNANPAQIRSLAVLPLNNISGDATQEYFADGMTDALIGELAQISSLRVISRTSTMTYKGARKPIPDVGRELNVDVVVDGAVVRSGARVRITVNLISAATDQHLWTKSYERDVRDVLALQSEIGRDVAQEIRVKLTPQQQTRLAGTRPVNAEAHEAYLKGLYYFNQGINERSEDILKKSSEYFRQAINLDPSYAPAHAGLSRSYHWVASYGIRSQELYPKAKAAALKALELDETLAEAHVSLGYILFNYDWDWAGCEREYKRAFELNPGLTYGAYGLYLSAAGRHDEAVAKVKYEEELDPLTIPVKRNVGHVLINARRYDEAIQQFKKVLELKPDAPASLGGLANAYAFKGRYAEALATFQKAAQISGNIPTAKAALAWVHAWFGKGDEARKILAELEATSSRESLPQITMATTYSALGEKDKAFSWLDRAYENHRQGLAYINVMPEFDNLHSDPRFQNLLHRLGFPS